MNQTIAYLPGLSPVENEGAMRPVSMCLAELSSDGGDAVAARQFEKRLGIAARLAGCLTDGRDPASTTHSYADMIRARMFAIACGYEDCDDLDVLRFDPAFKLACGRLPETGNDLMSQPIPVAPRERAVVAPTGAHGAVDDQMLFCERFWPYSRPYRPATSTIPSDIPDPRRPATGAVQRPL